MTLPGRSDSLDSSKFHRGGRVCGSTSANANLPRLSNGSYLNALFAPRGKKGTLAVCSMNEEKQRNPEERGGGESRKAGPVLFLLAHFFFGKRCEIGMLVIYQWYKLI